MKNMTINITDNLNSLIEKTLFSNHMTSEQREVLELIFQKRRLHQTDIIRHLPNLGRHHQDEEVFDNQSTTRKVRQVVRDLRVKFKIPILSDRKGYFLPTFQEEIIEWMSTMERASRGRAKAAIQTYESMKEATGIISDYFEKQLQLFEQ